MITLDKECLTPELVSETGISIFASVREIYLSALEDGLVSVNDVLTCRDVIRLTGFLESADNPDSAVAVHVLVLTLMINKNQGSLCLPLDKGTLFSEFSRFRDSRSGSLNPEAFVVSARRLIEERPSIFFAGQDDRPWPFRVRNGRLYFDRLFKHESGLAARLKLMLEMPSESLFGSDFDPARATLVMEAVSNGREGRNLTSEQKLAVFLAMERNFVVVSGGPGTGKTRILAALLRAWVMCGVPAERILLLAPTGRAGRRMGESISAAFDDAIGEIPEALRRMTGRTIHSALVYNPSKRDFRYGKHNPMDFDVFVCDEVSMVDAALMDRFLSAVPRGARIVFLGDRDQLPSVDAGAVLADLIPGTGFGGESESFAPVFSSSLISRAEAAGICFDKGSGRECDGAGSSDGRDMVAGYVTGDGRSADSVVILRRSFRSAGQVHSLARDVNAGNVRAFASVEVVELPKGAGVHDWGSGGPVCRIIGSDGHAGHGFDETLLSWLAWVYEPLLDGSDRTAMTQEAVVKAVFRKLAGIVVDSNGTVSGDSTMPGQLFSLMERARVLCALREGPEGVAGVNRKMSSLAGFDEARLSATDNNWFPGCPIMVSRNLHHESLFNGDIGVVLNGESGPVAVFRSGTGFRAIGIGRLGPCEKAFAVTVHKSQGSEYDNVLLILPGRKDHPLLTREILYTAITRARNNVWILGKKEALASSVTRRTSRHSGMDLWVESSG